MRRDMESAGWAWIPERRDVPFCPAHSLRSLSSDLHIKLPWKLASDLFNLYPEEMVAVKWAYEEGAADGPFREPE